ncbi:MAG: hypothetical protein ACI8QD_002291 [Cyclobacteriaceae bacterium]|jgi:hypothetical protein
MTEENTENDKREVQNYFDFKEVFGYFFRKKDPSRPSNINIKMMHGINKISILMFLICLIIIVSRYISRAM